MTEVTSYQPQDRVSALESQVEALLAEKNQRAEQEAHAALVRAINDLHDHLVARSNMHPSLAEEFAEPVAVARKHVDRMQPEDPSGVIRPPTTAEASYLKALVYRLASRRDHLELSYLPELADELEIQVLKQAAA